MLGDQLTDRKVRWARTACSFGIITSTLLAAATASAAGDVRHGQELFLRYCQGCHGPDGNGGGKGFMPHIGPLARKGYIDLLPDEYLATVIKEGGAATGKSGFMPSWKTTLTEQDIG